MSTDFLKYYSMLMDIKGGQIIDGTTSLKACAMRIDRHGYQFLPSYREKCHDLLREFIDITFPADTMKIKEPEVFHYITTTGSPVEQ